MTYPFTTSRDDDERAVLTLTSGSYTAEIGRYGATLRALRYDGIDLVVPSTPDLSRLAYSGRTLLPWPNRLADGTYMWEGTEYRVAVNEDSTNTALHGLAYEALFGVVEQSEDAVTLAYVVDDPGYPTTLEATVRYELSDDGLAVAISARNVGEASGPYGVSTHPYLTCGGRPNDECALEVPAAKVLRVDERLLPIEVVDVNERMDLRDENRLLGARTFDHAFTGLPEGPWEVTMRHPEVPFDVVMGAEAPWVQVYSGEEIGRIGAAIEPMTCPPDAFNSGDGLIVLEPGQEHTLRFTIRARA